MKKKLFLILIAFPFLTVTAILFQSCLFDFSYEAKICKVDFTSINPTYDNQDTFSGEVGFLVSGYEDNNCSVKSMSLGLVYNSYAMTKCIKWLNSFDTSSFQILLDQPLVIDGKTIDANINLFDVTTFKEGIKIKKREEDCKSVKIEIIVPPNLLDKMEFQKGVYNVTFKCETSDKRTFIKQRQVIFNI